MINYQTASPFIKKEMGVKRLLKLRLTFCIIVYLLLIPHSQALAYGERLALGQGAITTADFIDKDNDSTDDRYQLGPNSKPDIQAQPMLPKIEYAGSQTPKGVPDIRLGVNLYSLWFDFYHNNKNQNKIAEIKEIADILELKNYTKNGIFFSFPDGHTIFFNQEKNFFVVAQKGHCNVYQLLSNP